MRIRTTAVFAAFALALFTVAAAKTAGAQDDPSFQTAATPYASYRAGAVDAVDNFSGNLSLDIPIASYPQKGGKLSLAFSLHYQTGPAIVTEYCDSSGNCTTDGPLFPTGWTLEQGSGAQGFNFNYVNYPTLPNGYTMIDLATQDGDVVHHFVPITTGNLANTGNVWRAIDASGERATFAYNGNYGFNTTNAEGVTSVLETTSGQKDELSFNAKGSADVANWWEDLTPSSVTDANGNTIVANASGGAVQSWTDTMGRTIPAPVSQTTTADCPSIAGAPAASGEMLWNLPGPTEANNGAAPVIVCTISLDATYSYSDPNGNGAVGGGYLTLVQSVVLPNGKAWEMTYDPWGNLTQVTLPTGGSIAYTWNDGTPQFCDLSAWDCFGGTLKSRTLSTNDGTAPNQSWSYSYSSCSNDSSCTTTVTEDDPSGNPDPNGTTAVYTFNMLDVFSPYEVSAQYSGGGQQKTVITSYNDQKPFDGGGSVWPLAGFAVDVVPASTVTELTTGGNTVLDETDYSYDSAQFYRGEYSGGGTQYDGGGAWTGTLGLPTGETVDDFGSVNSGFPGAELRSTVTAYAYQSDPAILNANLLNLPSSVTVYNGSGGEAASTTYGYDSTGDRTSTNQSVSGSNELTSTAAFDSSGRMTSSTDAAQNTTTYSYAGSCYAGSGPTSVTDPMGLTTSYCYDANTGQETSVTDPNNQTTTYAYDIMRRPTEILYPQVTNAFANGQSFPGQPETTFAYNDTVGALSVETRRKMDNSGNWTDSFIDFDGLGRQTSTATLNGVGTWDRTDTCYNDLGETSFTSYPFQDASHTGGPNCSGTGDTFAYDGLGHLIKTTHSDGTTITRTYKANAVETTDEGSVSVSRVSQTDGLGRLISVCEVTGDKDAAGNFPADCGQTIDATGFLTTYAYDALGDLTNVTQGSETRSFNYDFLGRLIGATNPESGTTSYIWDSDPNCGNPSAGDLASSTDARGIRTCYQYNADHQVLAKSFSDGTPTDYYAYGQSSVAGQTLGHTLGRLSAESVTGQSEELFSYDALGRVSENWQCFDDTCSSSVYALPYLYDLAGDTTSAANGVGVTLEPTYNLEQQMTGLTSSQNDPSHPGTLASDVTYWPNGGLDTATLGNGVTETRVQDGRGRVDSITDGSAYSASIGYAGDGDVTSDTDSVNGTWTYGYDAQNRLTSASCTATCPDGTNSQAFSYSYDRYGNRWQQQVTAGSGPTPSFTFTGANNRMDNYSYDASGDLLNDGAHSYAYDAEHRVVSVDNGGTTYTYNAAGERATKSGGRQYLYDLDGNMVAEITNGVFSRGEVYAGGRRWATYANGATYFNYADWLGTVRVNTQYGGGWTQTCQSLPFGDGQACTNGAGPPDFFTGKPRDTESGNDYFGARYYNAASNGQADLGRFLTPDPVAGGTDNPQSLNKYAYVLNNPLTLTDPTGLTATGNSDSTGACLEDMGDCHVLPNGNCSIDGVVSFCDQAEIELEMGAALNCPKPGCDIVGQYFTSTQDWEPYRLIASDQGYQYIAINGEAVWPRDAWGELGLPQFSTGQGVADEFRLPYIPPQGPPRLTLRPPPRTTATVASSLRKSRSYAVYLACGMAQLQKNEDLLGTVNSAPFVALSAGNEAAAARLFAGAAVTDLAMSATARAACSQAVYGGGR